MTLTEWQQTEPLVEWMGKLANTQEWQLFLQMLQREHPMRKINKTPGFSASDDSKLVGIISGYEECLSMLDAAARPAEVSAAVVEPSYLPPEIDLPVEQKPTPRRKRR